LLVSWHDMIPPPSTRAAWIVGWFALLGCAPTTFESLPRPVLLDTSGLPGNCTSTLAIDARGDYWTEGGCEASSSGVVRRGRLTDSQRKVFQSAMKAVERTPDGPQAGFPSCGAQPYEHVMLLRDGGGHQDWLVCTQADGHRPQPFDAAIQAINAPP
jgi:hypothetical protein